MRTLQMIDPLPLKLGRKVTNVTSPAYEAALKAHEARKSELFAFLGKCDPHITEADCRKRKDAPAEQPKQSADAPQFKVGDKVLIRTIASWACGMWGVITDETDSRGERVLIVTVAGGIGAYRERDLELLPTEPAPQERQADAEGWISHDTTKPCPVPAETLVEVRLRAREKTYTGRALTDDDCMQASQWMDDGTSMDELTIVAYRVIA
jgi:hypothetical protein